MDQTTQNQVAAADLQPDPIPEGWVLSGAPQARAAELSRTPDSAKVTLLWDCTAGEYLWLYAAHETVDRLIRALTLSGKPETILRRALPLAETPGRVVARARRATVRTRV